MKIYKDTTSFSKEMWVCIEGGYLYMRPTLNELLELLNTEWRDEKHLVG